MKKMLITLTVLVASATAAFALNPVDYEVFMKLNDNSTFKGLVRYLKVDNEQAENLKNVFTITQNQMQSALKSENDAAAEKAMNSNLANTRNILSNKQYKKFLTIVNLTINNRYNEVLLSEN